MDPLSIAASIIGITTAAAQVSKLLKSFIESSSQAPSSARAVLLEVTGINACLHQLQEFLLGHDGAARSSRSLILVEQVIIIFTDCVTVFSELERILEGVKTSEQMRLVDRVKWARKESSVSRILTRLQASKTSLNLMLTISNCTSVDSAEASVRSLTTLVQEVLRNNVNMAVRLKTLERMHPALASSRAVSQIEISPSESSGSRVVSRNPSHDFAFEEELKASAVYRRALLRGMRLSTSSRSSNGPSWFSGLSLSDVSNVSTIALPIYQTELWNHQHYTFGSTDPKTEESSLDAWYNPPAKRSAFIRTAYFNGQYTNQYAQSKFTGHLIYRRFTIPTPSSPPVFTAGSALPLEKIREEASVVEEVYELEGNPVETSAEPAELERPIGRSTFANKELPSLPDTDVEESTIVGEAMDEGEPMPDEKTISQYKRALDSEASQQDSPSSKHKTKRSRLHSDQTTLQQRQQMYSVLSRSNSSGCYSLLCEEEESVFPKRVWKKPLAGMGDAEGWRTEVLGQFEQITY